MAQANPSSNIFGARNNSDVVMFNSTFRRNKRVPLDQSSVFVTYDKAKAEIIQPRSPIHTGQIVSILTGNPNAKTNEAVPYVVLNTTNGPTSYTLERLISFSYLTSILGSQSFPQSFQFGYAMRGVGQFFTYTYIEGITYWTDFGEIFNDYSNNSAGPYGHAEGFGNNAYGTVAGVTAAHAEGFQTSALADYAHSEGNSTSASAESAHAQNLRTIASGQASSSEGVDTKASGIASHSEGSATVASGDYSHVEGISTKAQSIGSHAEGNETTAIGLGSHVEGFKTSTGSEANYAHAEGVTSKAEGIGSHAEGHNSRVSGQYSHGEGEDVVVNANCAHAEGKSTTIGADAHYAHAEGLSSSATGTQAHAEGSHTTASGMQAHAEGNSTTASAASAHSEGTSTMASGQYAHSEGSHTLASGSGAHAEGGNTVANSTYAHTEGYQTIANNTGAHAEGLYTYADKIYSHAEGTYTSTYGNYSHAEGNLSYTYGIGSHAEGNATKSRGDYSHAEGVATETGSSAVAAKATGLQSTATGVASIAGGFGSSAKGSYSLAFGQNAVAEMRDSVAIGNQVNANGLYSVAVGNHVQTRNTYEVALGSYNISYTGTGADNRQYLEYCFAYMKNSGGTIFTIGNGKEDSERRNIYAIHANGDSIKTEGVSYYTNEVYAPLSYSYVDSMGITAYMNVMLRSLFDCPKYHRPAVGMKMASYDNEKYFTSSQTSEIQFGSSIPLTIGFRAAYVCPNFSDYDNIYAKWLGNRLGYSTAVNEIVFKYNNGTGLTTFTYDCTKTSYSKTSLKATNNMNQAYTITAVGLTYGTNGQTVMKSKINDKGIFSGRIYDNRDGGIQEFRPSAETYITDANLYGDTADIVLNSAFKPASECSYILAQLVSYKYAGATQMYFQQIADKGTYIVDDGFMSYAKFGASSYSAQVSGDYITWTLQVKQRYYYGVTDNTVDTNFNVTSGYYGTFAQREFATAKNHGTPSEDIEINLDVAGSPSTFWVAVPSDHIYSNYNTDSIKTAYTHIDVEAAATDASIRTASNNSSYMCAARLQKVRSNGWFEAKTFGATCMLDTGVDESDSMPIRKVRTRNTVGTTGLYYDIYYVNGQAKIPTGTIRAKIRRVW